ARSLLEPWRHPPDPASRHANSSLAGFAIYFLNKKVQAEASEQHYPGGKGGGQRRLAVPRQEGFKGCRKQPQLHDQKHSDQRQGTVNGREAAPTFGGFWNLHLNRSTESLFP